jgi:chlorite dismutase
MGGDTGLWRVATMKAIMGEPLPAARRLEIASSSEIPPDPQAAWVLRGITSNERYVVREERNQLVAKQLGLGRPEATCAALIPIRKNVAWWALTQDERQSVFEVRSNHAKIGLQYFPTLARRLHHCRDLSENEPFDFLTWFEYAPAHETAFNKLLAELRATEEWKYVEREVDIRLVRVEA